MTSEILDPRWDWIEIQTFGGTSRYIKGACRHLTPVPVESIVTGEVLTYLCPDCDRTLTDAL